MKLGVVDERISSLTNGRDSADESVNESGPLLVDTQTVSEFDGFMERRSGPRIERRLGYSFSEQLKILVPLFIVWLGGAGILVAVAVHGNVQELFLDPAYFNGGVWWIGLISQLGILGWTAAAASASWASWIAKQRGRTRTASFLRSAAVVTAWLLLDDLVGLHSMLADALTSIAVSHVVAKTIGLLVILAPLARWMLKFRRDIGRTRWQVLFAALIANVVSLAADIWSAAGPVAGFANASTNAQGLLEDGPKFLGILAWATYLIVTTYDIARSALGNSAQ